MLINGLRVVVLQCPPLLKGHFGVLAHLGEHRTCNAKAVGAEPTDSTNKRIVRSDVESSAGLLYSIRESELCASRRLIEDSRDKRKNAG